jgi:hypothetical protein
VVGVRGQQWVHHVNELEQLERRSRNSHMGLMTRRQVAEVQPGPVQHIQQRVVADLEPSGLETA